MGTGPEGAGGMTLRARASDDGGRHAKIVRTFALPVAGLLERDTAPGIDGVEDGGNFQSWPRAWSAMMREGRYDEPA
jgi:hypothetical protein